MRLFFATDAHGSSRVWSKWLQVPGHYGIDFILFCGDLTGKFLVPLVRTAQGYRATYFGRTWELTTEGEARELEERIAASGAYAVRARPEEVAQWRQDPKQVARVISEKMRERLREWLELLLSRIDARRIRTLVMAGNDDEFAIDEVIREFEDRGIVCPLDPQHEVVEFDGWELISLDYVNPTPWDTPREASEKQLREMIDRKAKKVRNMRRAIFNFHAPPHSTHLDLAPKLDRELRPVVGAGSIDYDHVGSKAVRQALEQYQPALGLHGHIHESSAVEKIGGTLCFNPGSEYGEGILRGYIVELSQEKIEGYLRVEG